MAPKMSFPFESTAFSVRRASWECDQSALRDVRTLVFLKELAVSPDQEWDQDDANAIHLLAVDAESRPIGTARLTDIGQIGRVAVLPPWRNRGVGSALVHEILAIASEPGRPLPFLNAQISAMPLYLRCGFVTVGREFLEAGILHHRMVLRR